MRRWRYVRLASQVLAQHWVGVLFHPLVCVLCSLDCVSVM